MTKPGEARVQLEPRTTQPGDVRTRMTEQGDVRALLHRVADEAGGWLEGIGERPVGPEVGASEFTVTDVLADAPTPTADVIAELVREAAPGLTALASPRFFGFVIGGAHPAAIAADWLVSAWDQNAGLAGPTPAVVAIEAVAGAWVLDLLGLPADASPAARWRTRPPSPPRATACSPRPATTSSATGWPARPRSAFWPAPSGT